MTTTIGLVWKYNNGPGFMCQAMTEAGYYTILQDEDKCGEPLFLEFHNAKDDYCTTRSEDITPRDWGELEDLQQAALGHALSLE
tara:strand:+ start:247 stop:498 length:252 start_codon:yes stop_codon:yes gene_type:complete